jgi:hypothetical protein
MLVLIKAATFMRPSCRCGDHCGICHRRTLTQIKAERASFCEQKEAKKLYELGSGQFQGHLQRAATFLHLPEGRINLCAKKAASSRMPAQNRLPSGPVMPPDRYTLPRGVDVSSVPTQRMPLSAVPNRKFSA